MSTVNYSDNTTPPTPRKGELAVTRHDKRKERRGSDDCEVVVMGLPRGLFKRGVLSTWLKGETRFDVERPVLTIS